MNNKPIVFITGMPRSGTKLFRDLLNNHSRISIPISETLIIPSLLKRYSDKDYLNHTDLRSLDEEFKSTKFYFRLGSNFPDISFFERFQNEKIKIKDVIELILLNYSENKSTDLIIGDKTPGYHLHLDLLISTWPNIKIIHMIRDPRDYAYSVHFAWKRSIARAADRWRRGVQMALDSQKIDSENYYEVKYEDLLDDTENVLTNVCKFIGVEYEKGMDELKRITEDLGNAKGKKEIQKDNKNKYKDTMNSQQIEKIESLVRPVMEKLGYPMETNTKFKPLSVLVLRLLAVHDGIRSLIFHAKNKGLITGVTYFFKVHHQNSTRGVLD